MGSEMCIRDRIEAALKQMKAGLNQMDQQGLAPMIASLENSGALKEGVESLNQGITAADAYNEKLKSCLLYTSPSPRDGLLSRMPSSA